MNSGWLSWMTDLLVLFMMEMFCILHTVYRCCSYEEQCVCVCLCVCLFVFIWVCVCVHVCVCVCVWVLWQKCLFDCCLASNIGMWSLACCDLEHSTQKNIFSVLVVDHSLSLGSVFCLVLSVTYPSTRTLKWVHIHFWVLLLFCFCCGCIWCL